MYTGPRHSPSHSLNVSSDETSAWAYSCLAASLILFNNPDRSQYSLIVGAVMQKGVPVSGMAGLLPAVCMRRTLDNNPGPMLLIETI